MSARSPPLYEIRPIFRAPLPFVYRWLTDYSSEDPLLDTGDWQRKIVSRNRRRVVLEDLTETNKGWEWYRTTIKLHPPDRWQAELRGNVPDWSLDYRLRPMGRDRTQLTIRWRIRRGAGDLGQSTPSKSHSERMMRRLWGNFSTALDRDFRRSMIPRTGRPPVGSTQARPRRLAKSRRRRRR